MIIFKTIFQSALIGMHHIHFALDASFFAPVFFLGAGIRMLLMGTQVQADSQHIICDKPRLRKRFFHELYGFIKGPNCLFDAKSYRLFSFPRPPSG
jgi:hypothetical protein